MLCSTLCLYRSVATCEASARTTPRTISLLRYLYPVKLHCPPPPAAPSVYSRPKVPCVHMMPKEFHLRRQKFKCLCRAGPRCCGCGWHHVTHTQAHLVHQCTKHQMESMVEWGHCFAVMFNSYKWCMIQSVALRHGYELLSFTTASFRNNGPQVAAGAEFARFLHLQPRSDCPAPTPVSSFTGRKIFW